MNYGELSDQTPTPLGEFFQTIDAADYEAGICSPRVQRVIHKIHNTLTRSQSESMIVSGDPTTGTIEDVTAFPVSSIANTKNWRLFASETGEPGEINQIVYFAKPNTKGEWEAVPVFVMLEKANLSNCSVSLCLPAASVTDLDWATVATQTDEARPITVDEALKDVPQTNADVLDTIIRVLDGDEWLIEKKLVKALHLNELHDSAFPKSEVAELFTQLSPNTRRDQLAQHLRSLGIFTELSNNTHSSRGEVEVGEFLQFTPLSTRTTRVERVVTNLGTTEKVRLLGHLCLQLDDDPQLRFIADDDLSKFLPESAEEEIMQKAEETYNIPEIVSDPEITTAISNIISDLIVSVEPSKHGLEFNKRLAELLSEQIDEQHLPEIGDIGDVLQLGTIDLSQLGDGVYFDDETLSKFRLSAQVIAKSDQSVFVSLDRWSPLHLFDCSVIGANLAFRNIRGERLYAKDCKEAFENSVVQDSVTENVRFAFNRGGSVGNIAQSCREAFTESSARDSLAINCFDAFIRIKYISRDLTAEFCDGGPSRLFTEQTKKDITKTIKKAARKERNLVTINSTARSIRNSYRAGKRFGSIPRST